jgi:hypothetical protein
MFCSLFLLRHIGGLGVVSSDYFNHPLTNIIIKKSRTIVENP